MLLQKKVSDCSSDIVTLGQCWQAGPGLSLVITRQLWPGELSWDRWAGPAALETLSQPRSRVQTGARRVYSISIRLIIFRHSQWYKPAVRPFLKPLRSQKITKNNRKVLQVRWEGGPVLVMWCSIGERVWETFLDKKIKLYVINLVSFESH